MWLFCEELLTILIVVVVSSAVSGLAVWGYCRLIGAQMSKAIEKELPRNGNGPPLSVLLQQSPRDTGVFKQLEE